MPEASVEERKQAMADESGINDDALLDRLILLNVEADTVAAVSLVPLIEVYAAVRPSSNGQFKFSRPRDGLFRSA